jgi:hypothetical protein
MSIAELDALISEYRNAALAHGSATEAGNHRLANAAHDRVASVYRVLHRQGDPAIRRLLDLLTDPEPAVRLWAASHGLEFASDRAVSILEELSREEPQLLGFTAETTLKQWRAGKLRFP